jgi:hypothetical protein
VDQLHRDIRRRTRERLRTWATDSAKLYEMAGLRPHDAICDIVHMLLMFVAQAMVTMDMSDKDSIEMFKSSLNVARKEEEEERRASRPH